MFQLTRFRLSSGIIWDADANEAKTFIDGRLLHTKTGVPSSFTATTQQWDIGDDRGNDGREWKGKIDDLAFFGGVLDEESISIIAASGRVGISLINPIEPPVEVIKILVVTQASDGITITWDSSDLDDTDFRVFTTPNLVN